VETWLVTGAAGFIGSHLIERLLLLGYRVRGLDNFSSGNSENVSLAIKNRADCFEMIDGDVRDIKTCMDACRGVDRILHHAAMASVPLSIENPASAFDNNQQGFVSLLTASRDSGVRRVVYASSSAVYGDAPGFPKTEESVILPQSPYALSKRMNEETAALYSDIYGMECVGLRYFNVFGPRQDPNGAYAAVIPRWLTVLAGGGVPVIYGDGSTSRDFCYIGDVVRANVLAATTDNSSAFGEVFNIASGKSVSLNELFSSLRELSGAPAGLEPEYEDFRLGDIRFSSASIEKARKNLGYKPETELHEGLRNVAEWYLRI
jgi:UDP-N-acetylglucosamine 4-epimerase